MNIATGSGEEFFIFFCPWKMSVSQLFSIPFFSIYASYKNKLCVEVAYSNLVALNQGNFPFLPFIVLVVLGMGFRSLLHFGFLKNGSMFLDRQAFWMKGLRDCQRRR